MQKRPAKPELDKAYDASKVEDAIYRRWEASGFFNPDKLPGGKKKKPFTIVLPPPNATGVLHVGHATMLALEDLMIRYKRMRGFASLWVPGTDHASIATQNKVEKLIQENEKKSRHDLGRVEFLKRVETFVKGSQNTIRNQIRKMGSSIDWSREAYTLDKPRSEAVIEMFNRMYEDGLVYRGERVVNWCVRCASTLADDEVEYKAQKAKLYFLKYGLFSVATTRPETKLGDTAVAANPSDERYKSWIGKTFVLNWGHGTKPLTIRVIGDHEVDMAFGSGLIGVTPAHSAVDFRMAEKNETPNPWTLTRGRRDGWSQMTLKARLSQSLQDGLEMLPTSPPRAMNSCPRSMYFSSHFRSVRKWTTGTGVRACRSSRYCWLRHVRSGFGITSMLAYKSQAA